LAAVERYDTAKKTWSTVAPLISARSDPAAYAHGGKIYVMGGCDSAGNFLYDVDVYDPVTDTWSAAPADMPTARAAFYAVGGSGDTIHAIGGYDGFSQLSTNEAYDVAADAWSPDTPMPTARAEMGLASHGGKIYTVGGGAFGASSSANEVFKP
jgi:N-acetylneuraminic acid mutarotase